MSEWETVAFRVQWQQSGAFPGRATTESVTVDTVDEVRDKLVEVTRRKPVTERGTWAPEVFEIQQRAEYREVHCGVSFPEVQR